mmetsp:Transcript_55603/g.143197  ORF Transcript_55603/g.143197 Transcript_55603/m.143197 type:complete len:567 (-) Transcript_55603:283-1983(-)|eukprot:CAMPEP_0195068526 /NCGR_PEP_ID=MMETSP0448-20130528/13208_1 /TAXON_ID=66468 /ORGANISM="Heterocapsa triquestra, Strain CCMP 448" /LENGTH=566 /DNA_ID=CAMNT_0040100059 /DNA_START=44 /DNA_END=1744 /DNA_ORIENTATION=-
MGPGSVPAEQGIVVERGSPMGRFHGGDAEAGALKPTKSTKSAYTRSVVKALTLKNRELLRGIPLAGVLHGHARVLRHSQGTADDFELSSPVSHLDAFLSHTWASPRYKKFMTLMVYYNMVPALVVGFSAAFLTSLLVGAGVVTSPALCWQPAGRLCELVGDLAFFATLFTWHEIVGYFGCKGPSVFLDKACVHQTDEQLKRQGIESLAAYLANAQSLIVLYSDSYLKRLWTVYELASFLLLGLRDHLEILPIDIPGMLLATIGLLPLRHLLEAIFCGLLIEGCPSGWGITQRLGIARILHEVAMAFLFTRWVRILRCMHAKLENFDILEAECACEEDRPLVQSNVEAFVKHIGKVEPSASQAEALEVFNELVRKALPHLVVPSLGPHGIRYKVAIVIFLHHFHWFDFFGQWMATRTPLDCFLLQLLRAVILDMCGHPLQVAWAVYAANLTAHLKGTAGALGLAFTVFAVTLASELDIFVRTGVFKSAKADLKLGGCLGLVMLLVYCMSMVIVTFAIYRPRKLGTKRCVAGCLDTKAYDPVVEVVSTGSGCPHMPSNFKNKSDDCMA